VKLTQAALIATSVCDSRDGIFYQDGVSLRCCCASVESQQELLRGVLLTLFVFLLGASAPDVFIF